MKLAIKRREVMGPTEILDAYFIVDEEREEANISQPFPTRKAAQAELDAMREEYSDIA